MKDYTLDQNSKRNYIVDMLVEDDGTITVIFADGTRFPGIAYTEENISTIASAQEMQAEEGLKNLDCFRNKATAAGICSGVSLAGMIVSGVLAVSLGDPGIGYYLGGISLIGVGLIAPDYFKNRSIMKELKKIQYRDENRKSLDSYIAYPNSLVGVKHRRHFAECRESGDDPYSILAIDSFSQDDLETIVDNVEREYRFQFTYQKRKNRGR